MPWYVSCSSSFSAFTILMFVILPFLLWSDNCRKRGSGRIREQIIGRRANRSKGERTDKQYMWATRMSHSPNMPSTETHFYQQAIVHLDASAATGDRLMDCIRAAYLLSAFQYMNGRHHSVSPFSFSPFPPVFFFTFLLYFDNPNSPHFAFCVGIELTYRDTCYAVIRLSESFSSFT
jgi:hypothetical protein